VTCAYRQIEVPRVYERPRPRTLPRPGMCHEWIVVHWGTVFVNLFEFCGDPRVAGSCGRECDTAAAVAAVCVQLYIYCRGPHTYAIYIYIYIYSEVKVWRLENPIGRTAPTLTAAGPQSAASVV
jgi:hypothetical protein